MKIYKYPLSGLAHGPDENDTINMPECSEILTVQIQNSIPVIWAKVDTETPMYDRRFWVIPTGFDVPDEANVYVGTVQMLRGHLVYHVFTECTGPFG